MDNEKAIRAAKLTLGGLLEKRRAQEAKDRAGGQLFPSQYLPGVPRQAHAAGGYVPQASLPIPRLAVAGPLPVQQQPGFFDAIGGLAKIGKSATDMYDLVNPSEEEEAAPEPQAARAEPQGHEGMSPEATAAMAALRAGWGGQDFGIVSAYRDPQKNESVGGAKGSQHIHGNAYDVNTTGWSPEDKLALADEAWNAGFRGIGFYDNNMHFDVGDPRAWGPDYHRGSIPDWAQPWAQERFGYADGGEVADLGQAREAKQLQGFHTGMMGDISDAASERMEVHQKALDAGVFDGYEMGDVLQGKNAPMKITGRFVRPWKPSRATLEHFDRMGAKPTIIEHNGKQYIPMLRTLTGVKGTDDWQEGDAYLDGVKAMGYPKMGGLRAVKARGGAVEFMTGNHPLVPEVLYHGTARDIRSLDPNAKRSYDVDPSNPEETDTGWFGKGHYFTGSPKMAGHYATEGARRQGGEGANVIPVHVSMKNPFVVNMKEYDSGATTLDQALTRAGVPMHSRGWRKPSEQTAALMQMGHDGVIAMREGKPQEYVAFKPEQVKSALSARKFDPTSPDMTYATGGSVTTKTKDGSEIFGNGALIHRYTHPETGGYIDVLQRPNGPASVLGLEVPEKHRGKGIGQMLQAEAMERHPELMGQVSSKAAATTAYRLGRRPYNAPDATLDDVFSAIDRDSSVNMLSPQAQPKAAGGAAMFEGIHPDLQDEQGNPKDLWHGTPGEPFDEFKDEKIGRRDPGFYGRGHYLTAQRGNAEAYADPEEMQRGSVMGPLHAALKNPFVWDASSPESLHRTMRKLQDFGVMGGKDRLDPWDALKPHEIDQFMKSAVANGHDGVIRKTGRGLSEIVVFKPSAIKHRDAERFDPNDPNIYHARGGVAK